MSGTGPSGGPPDLKRSSRGRADALAELEAVDGVDVVVGMAVAVDVVVCEYVVVCCAWTVGGDSHIARSAKPRAKTIRATAAIFSASGVRSAISSPSIGTSRQLVQMSL